LAQESQSAAGIWLAEETASSVMSDGAIDDWERSHVTIGHRTW
jgi:hypothetical protein